MPQRSIRFTPFLLLLLFLLGACGQPTATAVPTSQPGDTNPTQGAEATAVPAASPSTGAAPAETATTEPASSPEATTVTAPTTDPAATAPVTATAEVTATVATTDTGTTPEPIPTDTGYLDDRSTPQSLVASFFNAINQRQYLRAYYYWDNSDPNAAQPGPFDAFAAGYESTESVLLTVGSVGASVGAGQYFATVPVYIASTETSGTVQYFSGCYVTHLSSPDAQATVPFRPLNIRAANFQAATAEDNPATLLGSACDFFNSQYGTQPAPAPTTPNPADISAQRYLDDRSNGTQLLRSFFNALNSHQYLRAYSYWNDQSGDTTPPGTFDDFEAGYADLQSVEITLGEVTGDAGAGNFYESIPVASVATTATGETQTFVGCYVVHLSSPDAQGTPPFRPWGIQSATVQQVENDEDVGALLGTICTQS